MKKEKFYGIIIGVLILLNAGTLGFIWFSRPPHDSGKSGKDQPRHHNKRIVDELHLDADQEREFESLKGEHQRVVRETDETLQKLHEQYFNLLKADAPDIRLADSLQKEITEQVMIKDSATFSHFQKLKQLCKPEQKELFNAFIDHAASVPPLHEMGKRGMEKRGRK